MAHPTTSLGLLLLLLLVGLSKISGSEEYQDDSREGEGEGEISNDIPLISNDKRASNLGNRLMCQLDSRNCGAFNLGKKFIGYGWLRSMESRQRRTPYYVTNYRPHKSLRDNNVNWVKSYRY
uniref:Uncharacterized protein n=1 Tax=Graphocephala atropunctata TaxID=36148 RepID=A0A1B6KJH1_9HEMI